MSDLNSKIDELTALMEEMGLERAKWSGTDWSLEFATEPKAATAVAPVAASTTSTRSQKPATPKKKQPTGPKGTPMTSPMTGIFYSSPSPGAPLFAKEGDTVNAGQVVGLIEAMKVFNEITATVSGRVSKVTAENGQLVQPGDPLLYIE